MNTLRLKSLYIATALALVCSCMPLLVKAQTGEGAPVDLQADSLVHDDGGKTVTATGDVVLIQNDRTISADKIVYHLHEDTVVAMGHVVFTDENGDKHNAEKVRFNNALKEGFVEGLKTYLVDGSRFRASNGHYEKGTRTVMKDAYYTPCDPCKNDPEGDPVWQIRASEVEHDKESKSISYKNARFEVRGTPVAYLPYFSHPDGSVERKSGFLTPSAGYKSELGAFVQSDYYWSIAPERDLTVGVRAMTQESPLGVIQYRQRWENASLQTDGSFTYAERLDQVAGVDVQKEREMRGHISADARWDINNKWRSGAHINLASDDQYLRQYDFDIEDQDSDEDVLENELYVERFSGRNYAVGRFLAFQDVRVDDDELVQDDQDQPHILPEIEANFIGEPGEIPVIGGRWSATASLLGLVRDDDQQDVNRLHAALGWKRRLVSDYGLVGTLDLSLENSFYDVNDREGSAQSMSVKGNSSESRGFAYVNSELSYPVLKPIEDGHIVLEPKLSVTVAPNLSDDSIPNEDSQDVQIDALNLFEASRFPGSDGVEDRSHMTYGLRAGAYKNDGSYGDVFIGQSYRFDEHDNPFPRGSGLDDRQSDVVGQVSGSYKGAYKLDYRFQLDNHDLSSQRHEIDASMRMNRFTLSTQYLFAKALDETDIVETREQVTNAASYYINDKWRLFGSARHDLGEDPGMRTATIGLNYIGQCVSWSVVGQRTLTDESSGDSGTEFFLRLGLKNLGELETSGVQLGSNNE